MTNVRPIHVRRSNGWYELNTKVRKEGTHQTGAHVRLIHTISTSCHKAKAEKLSRPKDNDVYAVETAI
jgi:hypothetical protein